ncbi:HK97 gp10 family phage protein [Streptomyces mirabilis]|uniref:HK97 gp10 family phage protein n=1 Tax=Streptomyces sp. GbtcB7 TaxID=2824752 RepID=UPI0034283AEA
MAASLAWQGPAVRARTRANTRHHAMLLRMRIQRHASGRPGPNVITGAYRASWDVKMTVAGGRVTAVVFTEAPQARRLEYGFVGVDRSGRQYRQPPFPHIEPAYRETELEIKLLGSPKKAFESPVWANAGQGDGYVVILGLREGVKSCCW